MEKLQSIEKAAEVLGLSAWTVRAYVRQGKIRPIRIGRRVLIEPSEIQRVITEGKKPARTEPKRLLTDQ
jgi:excisionase family DNA binding protein